MASSYHSKKITEIKRIYGVEEENIIRLILENITDVDKKKYKTFPIGVTKQNMLKNAPFTETFLNLIHSERDKYSDSAELSFYSKIGNILKSFNPESSDLANPLDIYKPANRIQFLFLANVYCHSAEYFGKYKWLPQLLMSFEEAGLTGEFNIDNNLYNELFGDCYAGGTIKADLPFSMIWDPNTQTHIPDPQNKNLSNTSLAQQVGISDKEPVGPPTSQTKKRKRESYKKPPCKYGSACYQTNQKHRLAYSHGSSGHGSSGHGSSGGKKTQKRKRSKTKRSKTKRSKTKRSKTKRSTKKHKRSKTKRKQY
jgi:hypothetical protein